MAEKQNVNIQLLVAIGSISTVLLIVLVVGVQAWFGAELRRETEEKQSNVVQWKLKDLRLEQESKLQGYRWVDREAGTVAIPIERAMEITVRAPETGGTDGTSSPARPEEGQ